MEQRMRKTLPVDRVASLLPGELPAMLARVQEELSDELYLVGGSVRDLLLGRESGDLDLTVPRNAGQWAERLRQLTGGTLVELGKEEDAVRVVLPQGLDVDFSSFRAGTTTDTLLIIATLFLLFFLALSTAISFFSGSFAIALSSHDLGFQPSAVSSKHKNPLALSHHSSRITGSSIGYCFPRRSLRLCERMLLLSLITLHALLFHAFAPLASLMTHFPNDNTCIVPPKPRFVTSNGPLGVPPKAQAVISHPGRRSLDQKSPDCPDRRLNPGFRSPVAPS